jgi:hypothetical protein
MLPLLGAVRNFALPLRLSCFVRWPASLQQATFRQFRSRLPTNDDVAILQYAGNPHRCTQDRCDGLCVDDIKFGRRTEQGLSR